MDIKNTTFNYDDLGAGVILFFIYIGWMKFNNKLNTNTFKSIFKSIKNKTPITPLLYFIDLSIFLKINNIINLLKYYDLL